MSDHIPPTTDPHHPGESSGAWQSGDVFRATFFGSLAVFYAVLLFPLTVAVAVLWLAVKLLDRGPSSPSAPAA